MTGDIQIAAPKRTKAQREEDMNKLATLYVKRVPQMEIANQIGVSQGQISQDIKKLLKKWETEQVHQIDTYKREQLERINVIEEEMWEQWEHSKKEPDTETTKSKSGQFVKGKSSTLTGSEKKEMNETHWRILETKGSAKGNMEYMKGIMWCVQERAKMLGLYAPKKVAATNPEGDKEAGLSAKEELFAMVERVAARLTPLQREENIIDAEATIIENDESAPLSALIDRNREHPPLLEAKN